MNAIITKIESVNAGTIWTVTLALNGIKSHELDTSVFEAGEPFSDGADRSGHWFNFWDKPTASVGDQVTEDGEIIKAEKPGAVTQTVLSRQGPTLEEVYAEKHGLKIL